MGFLLAILIILLFFSLLFRWLPRIMVYWLNHKMNNEQNSGRNRNRAKEGSVYISKDETANKEKIIDKNMGEYVDYEPVDDKD